MADQRPFMESPPARPWATWLRRAFVLGLVAVAARTLQHFDWHALGETLRGARGWLVVAGALGNLAQIACKSERWRLLLAPVRRLSPGRLYAYLLSAYGASMVLPGVAGEVLRIYLLRRRHDVPVAVSTAVVTIEKLFDGVGLIVVVGALPFLLSLPRPVSLSMAALSAGGMLVTITLIALARRASRSGWKGRWTRLAPLAPGLACLTTPSMFAGASAWSLLAHLIECVAIKLLLLSVGLDLPWATGGLVLLAFSFAMVIPLVPGHAGTLEAASVAALGLLGAPIEKAIAFTLAYRVVEMVPMLLFALTGLGLVTEAREEQARIAEAPEAP